MLLAIYLNDHLAGATAGRELARRAASSNRDSAYGPFLEHLATQIEEDRQSLIALMGALEVDVDHLKLIGGWAAEKLGRLKRNGRWLSYSPLSRLIELEGLELGVRGKLALWTALEQIEKDESRLQAGELKKLVSRAKAQLAELEQHRSRAVREGLLDG
jgi:hypothetical protein